MLDAMLELVLLQPPAREVAADGASADRSETARRFLLFFLVSIAMPQHAAMSEEKVLPGASV
jgi:hypothetical protein